MRTCLLVTIVCGAVVSAQSGQPVRTPRLPETPYRYAAIGLPAHFEAAHAQDNTRTWRATSTPSTMTG